jgi:hypothetical protein
MKFNPIRRILYTDKGEIIGKLDCPYKVSFTQADPPLPANDNICSICNKEIVDTDGYDDEALLELSKTINLCLKVDSAQPNLRVLYIQ